MATTNVYLIMSEPMMHQTHDSRNAAIDSGDISYGSNAYNRPGAIEVLDFTFTIEQEGSEQAGRPRSVEKIARTDLKLTKAVDSRSPLLFRHCVEGSYIGAAELQCFGPDPTIPYLVYRMQFVHVSSYSPSGGEDVPTEEIGLRYGEMGVLWDDKGLGSARHGNGKDKRYAHNWSWVMEWPVTLGDPVSRIKEAAGGFRGSEHESPV